MSALRNPDLPIRLERHLGETIAGPLEMYRNRTSWEDFPYGPRGTPTLKSTGNKHCSFKRPRIRSMTHTTHTQLILTHKHKEATCSICWYEAPGQRPSEQQVNHRLTFAQDQECLAAIGLSPV